MNGLVRSSRMRLSISKCTQCARARLVDSVNGKWICFSCKQKIGKLRLKTIGKEIDLMAVAQ